MTDRQHFTTRRGFVAATGFGALALYATWAANGAAPLPFARSGDNSGPADAGGHGGHGGGDDAPVAENFFRRHADFLARFSLPDGSVQPLPAAEPHHGHGGAQPADETAAPVDVYVLASRFAFEPDRLVLARGQRYRFNLMAGDIAHGASIAFGDTSRIVRLRPGVDTSIELAFPRAGQFLMYCTVFCGAGHDSMSGRLSVA